MVNKHASHLSVSILEYIELNVISFTTDWELLKSEINSFCDLVDIKFDKHGDRWEPIKRHLNLSLLLVV